MKTAIAASGISSSSEIRLDYVEIEELLTRITSLQVIFETELIPLVNELNATTYYVGGEAGKAMSAYTGMLNKTLEIKDLYYRATQDISEMIATWIQTDEALASKIANCINNGSKLASNVEILEGMQGGNGS
ncbi:MAG: hypothetical protein SPI53_02370 [Erysipelotrichaceae bacterium]|nr:hypothetical protein [Erysipelotrichaceae bacterium]